MGPPAEDSENQFISSSFPPKGELSFDESAPPKSQLSGDPLCRDGWVEQTLNGRFERQVELTPEATAVSYEGESLTYSELNRRANRLAHRLREWGVFPQELIGLRTERGIQLVVGILGILKAGGAYLPLDPLYPKDRIAFMIRDSGARILVTEAGLKVDSEDLPVRRLMIDEPLSGSDANPVPVNLPDHLAYAIYTSGSTGTPKGVEITHHNVMRLFSSTDAWFGFNSRDVWTLFHSYSFDFSVWEIWGALLYGGSLVVVPYWTSRSPKDFLDLLAQKRVTVLNQTPSAFKQLVEAERAEPIGRLNLRYVIFGGEALNLQSLRPWLERHGDQQPQLVNMYGITETTVHVTYRPICWADLESGQGSVIGVPIPDLTVDILDPSGRLCAVGVPGEMYVGGEGVSRGYIRRDELNRERFLMNGLGPKTGGRVFRTGDLARRLENGDIEYLGRIDQQVKIRGFRVELGEIEAALHQHPGVAQGVVIMREDSPGDQRLVGYVVWRAEAVSIGDLKLHLSRTLPPYMVPSAFVILNDLPLTSNGKIDRRMLPVPNPSDARQGDYVAPRKPIEELLAGIWAEVLAIERVGIQDNFFELGGHSLLVSIVLEKMRQKGLHANARAVFLTPTIAQLAAAVQDGGQAMEVPPNLIPAGCQALTPDLLTLVRLTSEEIQQVVRVIPGGAANIQDVYPLSPLQEGILFHHRTTTLGDPYLVKTVFGSETREQLDRYLQALQKVIDRHDILRTAFCWEGLPEPVQVVCRRAPLVVEEVQLDPAAGDIAAQLEARLDPGRHRLDLSQAPIIRILIARDPARSRWVMLRIHHHLLEDHTTDELMSEEIHLHLQGESHRLPVPLPYRDFVAQTKQEIAVAKHEEFFRSMLGDVDEPTAPFGLNESRGDAWKIGQSRLQLDSATAKRIRQAAHQHGVSAAALFHLAWAKVLSQCSGREDVVFGTVLFGRMQAGPGADRIFGPFINTLPIRLFVGDISVNEALRQTHARMAQLLGHEHASLAMAQRCSALPATASLFSALLNFRHLKIRGDAPDAANHAMAAAVRQMGLELLKFEERTNYPLELSVDDLGDGFMLEAQAQAPLDPRRICDYLRTALEQIVGALENAAMTSLRSLSVLPEAEWHQVVLGWNDTAREYGGRMRLHHRIEEQVAKAPDAIALEWEEGFLSYSDLNRRANQLAHVLRRKGVGPDVLVGVFAHRSHEMVTALLAILKAGGAYVPLDPSYPAERLAHMLEDARVMLVLSQSQLEEKLPSGTHEVHLLDATWEGYAEEPGEDPEDLGNPEDLAYVIFTSGSTGRPKGAMNEHRAICNRLLWMQEEYGLRDTDRVLQKTPYSFDVSVWEFFWPLLTGARLVIARPDGHRDSDYLVRLIRDRGITTLHFVPSMLRAFLDQSGVETTGACLKRVICSGEALPHELQERFFDRLPGVELHNLYGPTEAAVDVTYWPCQPGDGRRSVPIGRPVANTQIYILDARLAPVPVGVPGELYIGGVQVGRGYAGRNELTKERFLPDPFSRSPGARVYKTGDLVRHLPDGAIEYLGRLDHQVKLRGQRLELGEIEAAIDRNPGVSQSVVIMREDQPGDQRLVAYVVASQPDLSTTALQQQLATQLPVYMVPSAFVLLAELPLTSSGKVDRKALPAPVLAQSRQTAYEPPRTPNEEILASIWSGVLGQNRVGIHDNFFELGGHSLLALSVIERTRRAGLNADVLGLFLTPTIAALAAATEGSAGTIEAPSNRIPEGCLEITPEMLPMIRLNAEEIRRIVAAVPGGAGNIQDIYPLAPLQEGFLFHHRMESEGDGYIMATFFGFDTRARLDAYLRGVQWVVDRHDIMRTAFLWEGLPEPVQVVCRRIPLIIEELAFDAARGDVAGQLNERINMFNYRFDLSIPPLYRFFFTFDQANDRWLLLQISHHLMDDQRSVNLQEEEILAHLSGRGDRLPAPRPFRNFVAQARLGVQAEQHEEFFRAMLGDVHEPTLPFGLTEVRGNGSSIAESRSFLESDLARRLHQARQASGVSAASLFHLAWALVLARLTGRSDVVFGTVLFGRMQGGEGADRVLGPCINTLPIRLSAGEDGVREGVRKTHRLLARIMRHEHAQLAVAQRCSRVAPGAPLFNSVLNVRHGKGASQAKAMAEESAAAPAYSEWYSEEIEGREFLFFRERTNYPITLSIDDFGEGFRLVAQVQAPIDPRRICEFMRTALQQIVSALESSPEAPLRNLDVLPERERHQLLVEWNQTDQEFPADRCIHQLFEEQVRRTPEARAVLFDGQFLTYRELNARANRLGHHLRRLGVGQEAPVTVCLERGPQVLVALLGILKAGGAYVALDPYYPQERLRFIVQDTDSKFLVTSRSAAGKVPGFAGEVVLLDECDSPVDPGNPSCVNEPSHLSYLIYTSGSTGVPKGVAIEHHNAVSFLRWVRDAFTDQELSGVLFATSICFDLSIFEMFGPLCWGGAVILVQDALELARCPHRAEVKLINTVPSVLQMFLKSGALPTSVITVNLAGEPLHQPLVDLLYSFPHIQRVNDLYGPSETTTYSTWAVREPRRPATIGRPIANTQVYLLDPRLNPVPIGTAGELWIGGEGVARGYWKRPELTADRFVRNPFLDDPGARLYRTGDLARHLPDGNLEYLGRKDHQVKIRGFRIELGELETVLSAHPSVAECVVVAQTDEGGIPTLVAFVVARGQADVSVGVLRPWLAERLPEYMIPSRFCTLPALPLTPNGKVDRAALPEFRGLEPTTITRYVAPRDGLESDLAGIWADLLRRERVGVHDHFFELGGHSLLAVTLCAHVSRKFHVAMPLRWLFEHPTVEGLAQRLAALEGNTAQRCPIEKADPQQPLLASYAQQRMWLAQETLPDPSAYHVCVAYRFDGPVDADRARRSLQAIQRRHEVLRTCLIPDGEDLLQQVQPAETATLSWLVLGLESTPAECRQDVLNQRLRDERSRPFDLARAPLWRALWIRMADERHVLLLTFHHCIIDDWSLRVFFHEWERLYDVEGAVGAAALVDLPFQYADFSSWQRRRLSPDLLDRQRDYWKEQLKNLPPVLELPSDRPRPAKPSGRGGVHRFAIPKSVGAQMRELARAEGTTLFTVMLSAFQVWLYRYTGQADLVVGTPLAQREQPEVQPLIGFFLNMLPIRMRLEGSHGFRRVISKQHRTLLDAFKHADLPFEQIVELTLTQRDAALQPLYQVMFVLLEEELPGLRLGAARAQSIPLDSSTSKGDLVLSIQAHGEVWECELEYASDLFCPETVARMACHLGELLKSITELPEKAVSQLNLVPEAERRQMDGWTAGHGDYPREACLPQLFEEQVGRTPDAVAVTFEGTSLTYAELNSRSNRLGHVLREWGVGPDVLVGLCVERSPDMVVAVLAILKAGGAYVPLDPQLPRERLQFMIEDTQAPVVLVQQRWSHVMSAALGNRQREVRLGVLEELPELVSGASPANLPVQLTADHLAYVMYTSGTTGRPKGVMVPHRGVVRLVIRPDYVQLGNTEVLLQFAPLGFDASTFELWGSLLNGARLVLAPARPLDCHELGRVIETNGVTTLWLTAALFHEMFEQAPGSLVGLRQLLAGGDVLSPTHVRGYLQTAGHGRLINGYGPTENTTFTCCCSFDHPDEVGESVSLGHPIAGTSVYLLDPQGQPVPVGVPGELWTGGDGLARGYLNAPTLTAERFVADQLSGRAGGRLYRTGDWARYRPDGKIEFLGRMDDQVKIRGYRVEPGEVEKVLAGHSAISSCAVIARGLEGRARQLACYIVLRSSSELTVGALREWLAERVPDYLIPSQFFILSALPLTPNGKADRQALERMGGTELAWRGEYIPPRNDLERELAEIWQAVLGRERVGVGDNFFELGGHSLMGISLSARIRNALQVEMPLRWLFQHPTIEGLARRLESREPGEPGREAIGRTDRQGPLLASYAQQRMWFLQATLADRSSYHVSVAYRFSGAAVDGVRIRRSLEAVQGRHEVLRTSLVLDGENLVQQVQDPGETTLEWRELDLTTVPPGEQARILEGRLREEETREFDFAVAPLWRVLWIRLAEHEHILALTFHHCIIDDWSLRILLQELGKIYEAGGALPPTGLIDLPVQYADYAAWQRRALNGEILDQQREYWREQLADLPSALELPADRPRPARSSGRGGVHRFSLAALEASRLRGLAREEETTLFTVMLAAFVAWLHRYTGQADLIVGTPLAQRERPEAQPLIGLFLNTLPIRVRWKGNPGFRQLLREVREKLLNDFVRADLPFEQIVELAAKQRDARRQPLYQAMFVLLEEAAPTVQLGAARGARLESEPRTSKHDLTLSIVATGEAWDCYLEYSTDLFSPETVARMAAHLVEFFKSISLFPERAIGKLNLLTEAERREMELAGQLTRREYPRDKCLHELIEEQASRTPDATAVICEGDAIRYGELNTRANHLAQHLRSLGVGPDVVVALCVERSVNMVVALLAILKAGGAYLPLDPEHPPERLRQILENASVSLLISESALEGRLPWTFAHLVHLDRFAWASHAQPAASPASPSSLAYVIYTSGSTGRPKGVEISHRALINCLWHFRDSLRIGPADVWLAITTLSFDISGLEIWLPLVSGARCVVASREVVVDGALLSRSLDRIGATILQATPATWRMLLLSGWRGNPRLRILCGGEALPQSLANQLSGLGAEAWNVYGPTETTIWSTARRIVAGESVNIGTPIANTRAYVLDPYRERVPQGLIGELFLGGEGLARGYRGEQTLTAERFIADPLSDQPGDRLYATGDLARRLPNGELEFLGRRDHQVKIRGHRIELGDIEAALRGLPGVRDAAVLLREAAAGEKRLVAFLASSSQPRPTAAKLRELLAGKLPAYMIPSGLAVLDALPLTPSGKVDRKALEQLEGVELGAGGGYVAPRTELERELAELWQEMLGREQVGIEDDFFALGGHSLLAARLFARLERRFGRRLPLATLVEAPTIEGLAAVIQGQERPAAWRSLVLMQPRGSQTPVFLLHGLAGNIVGFNALVQHLGVDRPVYGLQSVGLDGSTPPPRTIPLMAAHYVKEVLSVCPDGPFHLAGLSFGGMVAYEMALQLKALGKPVGVLALFDTFPRGESEGVPVTRRIGEGIGHWSRRAEGHWRDVRRLGLKDWPAYLALKGHVIGTRARTRLWQVALKFYLGVLDREGDSFPKFFTDIEQSNRLASQSYVTRSYPGRVTLFMASTHISSSKEMLRRSWNELARGGVEVVEVPGDHVTLITEPHVVVLAEKLRACLDRFPEKEEKKRALASLPL